MGYLFIFSRALYVSARRSALWRAEDWENEKCAVRPEPTAYISFG